MRAHVMDLKILSSPVMLVDRAIHVIICVTTTIGVIKNYLLKSIIN